MSQGPVERCMTDDLGDEGDEDQVEIGRSPEAGERGAGEGRRRQGDEGRPPVDQRNIGYRVHAPPQASPGQVVDRHAPRPRQSQQVTQERGLPREDLPGPGIAPRDDEAPGHGGQHPGPGPGVNRLTQHAPRAQGHPDRGGGDQHHTGDHAGVGETQDPGHEVEGEGRRGEAGQDQFPPIEPLPGDAPAPGQLVESESEGPSGQTPRGHGEGRGRRQADQDGRRGDGRYPQGEDHHGRRSAVVRVPHLSPWKPAGGRSPRPRGRHGHPPPGRSQLPACGPE